MRNRGLSKVYLVAGIVIGLVVLLTVIRLVAYNANDDLSTGGSHGQPTKTEAPDPFPRPDPAGEPDRGPTQP